MDKLPRVWVGTLYSGEAEYKACCDAIQSQERVHVTHHVIEGLPEKEAHDALWTAWGAAKDTHDLFVKVDADTIPSPRIFSQIATNFAMNPDITGMQIRLLDYFTNELIAGMNAFSRDVIFKPSPELHCDRVDIGHRVVIKGSEVFHLEPAGTHASSYSTRSQAFHYGLHRYLKGQHKTLNQVRQVWETEQDEVRAWALAGADWAHKNMIKLDYTDLRLQELTKL